MKPTPNIVAIFLVSVLVGLTSCGLLGAEDKKEPELEPGHRNYSWTVDSVYSAPSGWIGTIWGSSTEQIWMGSGGGFHNIWLYNGSEWKPYRQRLPGSVYSIFGLSRTNVWLGANGGIYELDLGDWNKEFDYRKEGFGESRVRDIWGTSEANVYAVGNIPKNGESYWRGFVLRYTGTAWEEVLVTDFHVQFQVVRSGKQGAFIRGIKPAAPGLADSLVLYKVENSELKEIMTVSGEEESAMIWVNTIQDDIYILKSKQLYRYEDNRLKSIADFSEKEKVFSFFGRNEKDIFLVTDEGITHFNGSDTQLMVPRIVHPRAAIFDKEVFFFRREFDIPTNLIFHGKLLDEEE